MLIQVNKIDVNGFIVEPVVVDENDNLKPDYIKISVPGGLYSPKWNGSEWVEGMSQVEIDALKNQPVPLSPLEEAQKQLTDLSFELMIKGVL